MDRNEPGDNPANVNPVVASREGGVDRNLIRNPLRDQVRAPCHKPIGWSVSQRSERSQSGPPVA